MVQETAGTHRANTQSTPGTWFQGKRLPLYGVVAATVGLAGYVAFFQNVKHPSSNSSISDKNTEIPGKSKEQEGKEYSENQPTRKLMHAAGKKEGDANIFPNKEAGQKMSESKNK